jgi:hypothetical protein
MQAFRAASLGLILATSLCHVAQACRGPMFERSIFFEDVTGLDVPVIVRVEILTMLRREFPKPGVRVPDHEHAERFTLIGLARVDAVIKGELGAPMIKVAARPSSCGPYFDAGVSGIVAGTLTPDPQGVPVLQMISESPFARERRLKDAGRL